MSFDTTRGGGSRGLMEHHQWPTTPSPAASAAPPQPQPATSATVSRLRNPIPNLTRRWSCEGCRTRKIKCDGVRPTCGYCLKKGYLPCVFLGSKKQIDADLAKQHQTVVGSASKPPPPPSARSHPSQMLSPPRTEDSTASSIKASNPALHDLLNSMRIAGSVFVEPTGSEAGKFEVMQLRRPGSIESEERILVDLVFSSQSLELSYIHKRWYIMNFPNVHPLLRLAVCAFGASIMKTMKREDAVWYFEQARQLATDFVDNPSVEVVQSLLLMSRVALNLGDHSGAWQRLGFACSMCLFLNLDTDPDDLPRGVLASDSWIEKETRRRVYWEYTATMTNRVPIIKRNLNAVKSPCTDTVWNSMKDPAYWAENNAYRVGANEQALMYYIQLLEIRSDTISIAMATPDSAVPVEEREVEIEKSLLEWRSGLPERCWVEADKGSILEALFDAEDGFMRKPGLFLFFHGSISLLWFRRSLIYFRHAHGLGGGSPDMRDNLSAFAKAVSSAEAIARLCWSIISLPVSLNQLPRFSHMYICQATMILLLARQLNAISLIPSQPSFEAEIDAMIRLLRLAAETGREPVFFYVFLKKVMEEDWEYLADLEGQPFGRQPEKNVGQHDWTTSNGTSSGASTSSDASYSTSGSSPSPAAQLDRFMHRLHEEMHATDDRHGIPHRKCNKSQSANSSRPHRDPRGYERFTQRFRRITRHCSRFLNALREVRGMAASSVPTISPPLDALEPPHSTGGGGGGGSTDGAHFPGTDNGGMPNGSASFFATGDGLYTSANWAGDDGTLTEDFPEDFLQFLFGGIAGEAVGAASG
ncbi:fungal-specific transcription factor domain-containing protein [Zopfochytrium polystomum]|nr:fungal-specific transcription factor domain-containing protein [Zopfochytrium polystomum]